MTMKYRIDEKQNGIDIQLDEIAGKKEQLLESFAACRDGRCACPTGEYRKLESLEIDETPGTITLHLKSKPGEKLETSEIIKCLKSTESRTADEKK